MGLLIHSGWQKINFYYELKKFGSRKNSRSSHGDITSRNSGWNAISSVIFQCPLEILQAVTSQRLWKFSIEIHSQMLWSMRKCVHITWEQTPILGLTGKITTSSIVRWRNSVCIHILSISETTKRYYSLLAIIPLQQNYSVWVTLVSCVVKQLNVCRHSKCLVNSSTELISTE